MYGSTVQLCTRIATELLNFNPRASSTCTSSRRYLSGEHVATSLQTCWVQCQRKSLSKRSTEDRRGKTEQRTCYDVDLLGRGDLRHHAKSNVEE